MEPRRPRPKAVVAALAVLFIVTGLGFAAPLLPLDGAGALAQRLDAFSDRPWAPAAAVAAYFVLATLGAPQVVLIGALVLVFGPFGGFLWSWTGKMAACAFGFLIGRRYGAGLVLAYQSDQLARFMAALGRHGFWVSAGIRLAPTVPSVLINIAAGATPIRFWPFMAGTALGSVPKMALYALGGAALLEAVRDGGVLPWLGVAAAVLALVVFPLALKRWRARA